MDLPSVSQLKERIPLRTMGVGLVAAVVVVTSVEASSRQVLDLYESATGGNLDGGSLPIRKPLLPIAIDWEEPTGSHKWRKEAAAHLIALAEAELADRAGVLPRVDGASARPSIAHLESEVEPWSLTISPSFWEERFAVDALLCPRTGRCFEHRAEGDRLAPEAAITLLIHEVAGSMGLPPPETVDIPTDPASVDDYAVLMLGRSAASALGLMPRPSPELRGDPTEDPVHRAVFVDSSMDLAWSLLARTEQDPKRRTEALEAIRRRRPIDLADLAGARTEVGDHAGAWEAWQAYQSLRPDDPRFVFARAAAAAREGLLFEVQQILKALPDGGLGAPETVVIEVALAEAAGGVPDRLLEDWQSLQPRDPTPVRRRIARFVADQQHAAALDLTPHLDERGAHEEAQRLTLALASDLGDTDRASSAATALGRPETARRLRMAADKEWEADLLPRATSPEGRLRRAERWLEDLQPKRALEEAQALAVEYPWWPEALEVERRAWAALGVDHKAAALKAQVRNADPLFYERPRERPDP